MVITNDDVKLFESQHLTDEEDGGGQVTGREVMLIETFPGAQPVPGVPGKAGNSRSF